MKITFILGLCLSLLTGGLALAAPRLEEDEPHVADPSWATGIRTQLDNEKYDDALAALQKLEPKYGKSFQYHALTGEAYEGKSVDADAEKDEIRWLKKARESYLKAESLAAGKDKATVHKIRELVEADLKDYGVTFKTLPSKAPAKPATKKALNGVTLSPLSVDA